MASTVSFLVSSLRFSIVDSLRNRFFGRKKHPETVLSPGAVKGGRKEALKAFAAKKFSHIFFHPDCTVGTGVAPVPAPEALADFTADREFHPALKTSVPYSLFVTDSIPPFLPNCKRGVPAAILSQAECGAGLSAPGVINHHPEGAKVQSWPSAEKAPHQGNFLLYIWLVVCRKAKKGMTAQALGLPSAAAAQCLGSRFSLCSVTHNQPSFDCLARQRSMGLAARWAMLTAYCYHFPDVLR